jgi:hypothetical protein
LSPEQLAAGHLTVLAVWHQRRKTLLIIAGILYVLFGILAFFGIPGGHEAHHHTRAHNLTHLFLGVGLLVLTLCFDPARRRVLCFGLSLIYLLIGLYGALEGKMATLAVIPGLVEFHAGDYVVHLFTSGFFLFLGLLRRSDRPSVTAAG